ncbi:RIP metalloprotease RseP [Sungkyunkwania multivorans]|uniref:Zinc metalloprotease n=1 Tax=Sungkyunkwania multivorans TaxID=1173618 RepID=A0ABW3CYV4_9FLAO
MSATEIFIIVIQFLLSLSLLIILHEAGHFIPARFFGIRVEKFFLFFDVKFALFKKKIGDTVYGVGWLPLGGYVKISGMIDESMDTEQLKQPAQPWEFRSKPAWQRLIIMLGGVFVNFVLAWIIYVGMSFAYGEKYLAAEDIGDAMAVTEFMTEKTGLRSGDMVLSVDGESFDTFSEMAENIFFAEKVEVLRNGTKITLDLPSDFMGQLVEENRRPIGLRNPMVVGEVAEDSPNAGKELQPNDIIIGLDGNSMKYFDQVSAYLDANKGETMTATVLRDGKEKDITVYTTIEGKLGVVLSGLSQVDLEKLGYLKLSKKEYGLVESFGAGTDRFFDRFASFGKQLKALVTPSTGAYKGLGSFISIAKIFPTTWNWEAFWNITAFLSIMLGVLNLLPIPALDGGHAMFLLYEMILGKKPSDKFLEYAQMVGFLLLITLFVFAFGNDIYRNFMK